MLIHHVATVADWEAARETGSYTTSTLGVTLEQQGFLHASRREQVGEIYDLFYADLEEPLVLLVIDTDLLDVPWREDPVGEDTYPHVYGALSPVAVLEARPLTGRP